MQMYGIFDKRSRHFENLFVKMTAATGTFNAFVPDKLFLIRVITVQVFPQMRQSIVQTKWNKKNSINL